MRMRIEFRSGLRLRRAEPDSIRTSKNLLTWIILEISSFDRSRNRVSTTACTSPGVRGSGRLVRPYFGPARPAVFRPQRVRRDQSQPLRSSSKPAIPFTFASLVFESSDSERLDRPSNVLAEGWLHLSKPRARSRWRIRRIADDQRITDQGVRRSKGRELSRLASRPCDPY